MAFLVFNRPYKGHRAMSVTHEKALAIQQALHYPQDDVTEEQAEFLLAIDHIYFGKAAKVEKVVDTSHLTNPGIQQSSYDAIPTGDR